jgi:hypothetical protein
MQAPERVDVVEDGPRDLVGDRARHPRAGDDDRADAESRHVGLTGRVRAPRDDHALVFLVPGEHAVGRGAAHVDQHALAGTCHVVNQPAGMADRVDDDVQLLIAEGPVLLDGRELPHLREIASSQAEGAEDAIEVGPLPRAGIPDVDPCPTDLRQRADAELLAGHNRQHLVRSGEEDSQIGGGPARAEGAMAGHCVGQHVRRHHAEIEPAAAKRLDARDGTRRRLFRASQTVA